MGTHIPEQADAVSINYQVGAWGDNASRGNLGVRAEIRTNVYPIAANSSHVDAFWVGSNLANGAFIQFGYQLLPGNQSCSSDEAVAHPTPQGCIFVRLFWEYWPNATGTVFIQGIIHFHGPTTFDINGTWHSYEISPSIYRWGWFFKLDGRRVSDAAYVPVQSESSVYVAAEQVTTEPPSRLGPVEFRNMSYLKNDEWHPVKSLIALVNECPKQGSNSNPYGVSAIGPNHIIAGSGIERRREGQIFLPNQGPLADLFSVFLSEEYRGLATPVYRIFWVTLFGIIALVLLKIKRKLRG